MRSCLILLFILMGFVANAQSTNSPLKTVQATNTPPVRSNAESLQAQTIGSGEFSVTLKPLKPNEIASDGVIFSGIAVEIAKKGHPLELFNPLASPVYGSSEANTVRDLSGRAAGLKIFSIKF